jgi:hypothetical protein
MIKVPVVASNNFVSLGFMGLVVLNDLIGPERGYVWTA